MAGGGTITGGGTGGTGGSGGGTGGGGGSGPTSLPWPSLEGAKWRAVPAFVPFQVAREFEWDSNRDENRGADIDEDGSFDDNGRRIYLSDGSLNPDAGAPHYYATDPFNTRPYWDSWANGGVYGWPSWKWPPSYKNTIKSSQNSTATVSWEYSQDYRTGGWVRTVPYPCIGPRVLDKETGNYKYPVYTNTNPAPEVNPDTGEVDSVYYDNGYKNQETIPYAGGFSEYSICYAEVSDDLTEYDYGQKPQWLNRYFSLFRNYSSYAGTSYNNGNNGFEIHKDHYDEYDVSYGDYYDGSIENIFLYEENTDYKSEYISSPTVQDFRNTSLNITTEYTPLAQVAYRPAHKRYLGYEYQYKGMVIVEERNGEVDYKGNGSSVSSWKYSMRPIEYTLQYGSEHIPEFDPNKPYDSNPDRDSTTPPPDYNTWPQGSVDNVSYEGYTGAPTHPYQEYYLKTGPIDYYHPNYTIVRKGVTVLNGAAYMLNGIVNRPWTGFGPPTEVESYTLTHEAKIPVRVDVGFTVKDERLDSTRVTLFKYYGFGKVTTD